MTRLFLNTFIPTITSPVSIVPAEAPVKSYGFNLVLYATVLSESDCPATINLSENIVKATNEDNSINNPFTAAFESAQGKGLAGFITSLNIGGIMDSPWETSRMGSKAPMMVKIDIGFAPTHDIPPGLDHDGMMRAPTYNVGRLMNELFDDVYDE